MQQRIGIPIGQCLETLHIDNAQSVVTRCLNQAKLLEFDKHRLQAFDADPEITSNDCAFQSVVDKGRIAALVFVLV